MWSSLARKFTVAFVFVAITVAVLVAVIVRFSNASDFDRLVIEKARSQFSEAALTYYQTNGSWDGITLEQLALWRGDFPRPLNPDVQFRNIG